MSVLILRLTFAKVLALNKFVSSDFSVASGEVFSQNIIKFDEVKSNAPTSTKLIPMIKSESEAESKSHILYLY